MEQSRDSIKDIWGKRTPYKGKWPVRADQQTIEEPDHWVQSACVLCSNGCGMDIGVKDGKIVGVRGRVVDAVNYGRLGPKGMHGRVANNSKDRLNKPLIRKNGKLEEASWCTWHLAAPFHAKNFQKKEIGSIFLYCIVAEQFGCTDKLTKRKY